MTVLVAEGDPNSRARLESVLNGAGYVVQSTGDGVHAARLLRDENGIAAVLLGGLLGGIGALEIVKELRSSERAHRPYVILLVDDELAGGVAAALDAGADDCLKPSAEPELCLARVRAGARIAQLQQQLAEAREQHGACHRGFDPATGLLGRATFLDAFTRLIALAERSRQPCAVFRIAVEEAAGEQTAVAVGQQLLCAVADRLRNVLRAYDVVARYDGRFVVAALHCDEAHAQELAQRLAAAVSATPVQTSAGPVSLSARIGVAATDQRGRYSSLLYESDHALETTGESSRTRSSVEWLSDDSPARVAVARIAADVSPASE